MVCWLLYVPGGGLKGQETKLLDYILVNYVHLFSLSLRGWCEAKMPMSTYRTEVKKQAAQPASGPSFVLQGQREIQRLPHSSSLITWGIAMAWLV